MGTRWVRLCGTQIAEAGKQLAFDHGFEGDERCDYQWSTNGLLKFSCSLEGTAMASTA